MRTLKLKTEGYGDRLPDENWRTLQQVRDSKLLIESIEQRNPEETVRLASSIPRKLIQQNVLPKVSILSRTWFWRQVTTEEQLEQLISSMHQAAFKLLSDGEFVLGVHFSVAPLEDFPALLVSPEANAFLEEVLPVERYSSLQMILRLAPEEEEG